MPSSTEEELQLTSVEEWNAVEGQIIPLPSGRNIRVRRTMDILALLKAGKIPNPLGKFVQRMVDTGGRTEFDVKELGVDGLTKMMELVDDCVIRSVTEPKVVAPPVIEENEDPAKYMERVAGWRPTIPGTIGLNQIDIDDRMHIFLFAQGMAADLEPFREEQGEPVAPAPDVKAVPKKTKRTGGNR